MTAAAHVYPNATQELAAKAENLNNSDTLRVGLATAATAYTWNSTSQAHKLVSDFLAGSGAGAMTEVSTSSTGYARLPLTSVAVSTTGLVTTLTAATMAWTATANWSAAYAFFYDYSVGGDTSGELIAYWDFGGTVSVVSGGNFTLTVNASGIVTWTAS